MNMLCTVIDNQVSSVFMRFCRNHNSSLIFQINLNQLYGTVFWEAVFVIKTIFILFESIFNLVLGLRFLYY